MQHKALSYQTLFYLRPKLLEIAAWPNCNNDLLLQFFKEDKSSKRQDRNSKSGRKTTTRTGKTRANHVKEVLNVVHSAARARVGKSFLVCQVLTF